MPKEPALRQVRLDLALAAIIKEENLEATDEEVEAEFKKMAEQYNMDLETVKKYLQADQVKDQILTRRLWPSWWTAPPPSSPRKKAAKKAEDGEEGEEKKPAKKTTRKSSKKTEEAQEPKKLPRKRSPPPRSGLTTFSPACSMTASSFWAKRSTPPPPAWWWPSCCIWRPRTPIRTSSSISTAPAVRHRRHGHL